MRWLVYAALFALVFSDGCVYPGQTPPETCDAPTTAKNSVVEDVPGRGQWPNRDGYCGSNSIQMIALTYGAWISQDLVRKSVGNNEILHTNIQQAITTLLFTLDSWNYTAYPIPQYKTYLTWLKTHLLQRQPVIWFIYCQGDSHGPHGGDGYYDHIEPVFGVWTNSTLNDTDWYPDDVLVHNSDWDQNHYYRPFDTLWDTAAMDGNCADAPSGSGHNEMYPCIPSDNYDYGYSMMGFVDPAGKAVQAQLYVSDWEEPDLDDHKPAENMTGKLVIRGIQKGTEYFIYRWDDVNECPGCLGGSYTPSIPSNSDYANSDWDYKYSFSAPDTTYTFQDPHTFLSSGATYYRVVPAA